GGGHLREPPPPGRKRDPEVRPRNHAVDHHHEREHEYVMRYADRVKKDPSRSLVYAMAEESLAFYALVITVLIAARFDPLTGAAVVLLGCGIGLIGSTVTTFATGIAWGIAGVPISEGLRARARDRARQRPPGRPARADGLGLQGGRGVPPRRPRRAD